MKGNHARFKANHASFLRTTAIECYNIQESAMKAALRGANASDSAQTCAVAMEFDLVPQKQGHCSLQILGSPATHAKTGRRGSPILARWIPYLGQKKSNSSGGFGYINLTTMPQDVNYVFSAGLGGCNFVVVQDGGKRVYHEPTAEAWSAMPTYAGNVLLRAGPRYDDSTGTFGGFGLLTRESGSWKIYMQTIRGTTVTALDSWDVP